MTHDALRIVTAAAVIAAFLLLCFACLRRRTSTLMGAEAVLIAYASQTGFAESLARAAAEGLRRSGAQVEVAELGELTVEHLARTRTALFVAATTGDGDPPDRALRFARAVLSQTPDLSRLQVGVLALGDRSYADYCGFGRRLSTWLTACGAQPLFDPIEVDAGDRKALARWRKAVGRLRPNASPAELGEGEAVTFQLTGRLNLNPEGVGDPAFLLSLTPQGAAPVWQAGDVVEVEREGDGAAIHREYSIASLPADGAVELIVRRFRLPDGGVGAMSGWLTGELPVGGEVRARVRTNSSFHAPLTPGPTILIGSGTGLAGLRAHIRALPAPSRAWLLFGERSRAGDFLLREEVEGWLAQGRLSRLDLAFSRDKGEARHVQDLVRREAESLQAWIAEGATLFVCGRQAMGQGVDAALAQVLGAEAVKALREDRRYRRDVY